MIRDRQCRSLVPGSGGYPRDRTVALPRRRPGPAAAGLCPAVFESLTDIFRRNRQASSRRRRPAEPEAVTQPPVGALGGPA
eukprot:555288-Hanusia_phi.AAC.1